MHVAKDVPALVETGGERSTTERIVMKHYRPPLLARAENQPIRLRWKRLVGADRCPGEIWQKRCFNLFSVTDYHLKIGEVMRTSYEFDDGQFQLVS